MGIDQKRIVKLILPLSEEYDEYFSGYIIADGVIITSRHGFIPEARDIDDDFEIKVESQDYQSTITLAGSKNIEELEQNGVVLFQSKKYDIVLLKDSNAKGNYASLSLLELEQPSDWEGGGYPHYNKGEVSTKGYESISGTVETPAMHGLMLKLRLAVELKEMINWAKISGSPIFLDGRLAGIVKHYDNDVKNRLEATYLKRLWDDEDPKEKLFKIILEKYLPDTLETNKEKLSEFLEKEITPDFKNKLNREFPDSDNLVSSIINADEQEISNICSKLKNDDDTKRFLDIAMSCHYSNQQWLEEKEIKDSLYKESPFVRDEPIEYSKAAKSGRDPQFIQTEYGIQAGGYSITSAPFNGINSGACNNIEKDIASANGVLTDVDTRLVEAFNPRRSNNSSEAKANFRTEVLNSGKYYWIIDTIINNTQLETNIKEVHEKYKQIDIIKRSDDQLGQNEIREKKIFDPLEDILKK